jgi:hypothetical protein
LKPAPTGRVPEVMTGFWTYQKQYFEKLTTKVSLETFVRNAGKSYANFPFVARGGLAFQRVALLNKFFPGQPLKSDEDVRLFRTKASLGSGDTKSPKCKPTKEETKRKLRSDPDKKHLFLFNKIAKIVKI